MWCLQNEHLDREKPGAAAGAEHGGIAGDAGHGRVPWHGAGSWENSREFPALQSRLSPGTLQSG